MGGFQYPSILIIGHGELGLSIITSLRAHPSKLPLTALTVLARPQTVSSISKSDPAKYSLLDSLNIHWLPLDIESASDEELKKAFSPFTAVIHASGMFAAPGVATKITNAVLNAGVKYFIPWQFGVDYDVIGPAAGGGLFAEQYNIRKILREENSGTKWNIVSNGLFTSFVFFEPFGIINKDKTAVTALGGWDNKVTLTAAEDIGKLTAAIIYARLSGNGNDGVIYISGETLTYGAIADAIEAKAGRPLERKVLDIDTLQKIAEEDPDNKLVKYQLVFGQGVGCSWASNVTFNEEKGIKTSSFVDWLDSHIY